MFGRVALWLCEDITACCYMYCYFRNIFPPWSSQMTILLITNAMYHIRYTNGEYEFKRINPHGLIPRKSTLLKSSDICILCRTNTLHACMVFNGSGDLHARRVLKHRPMLAPVSVADLRSDRSRIQCLFRQTLGKAHTTR